MNLRTVTKLGVAVSVILFCVASGFYAFARLSMADKENNINLLAFVPASSIGVLETDNIDYFVNEFPQTSYSLQLDTLCKVGFINAVLTDLVQYTSETAHGLSNQMNHMMVSFHAPGTFKDLVAYFRMGKDGKKMLRDLIRDRYGIDFSPKHETYRGKNIEIYSIGNTNFLSAYSTDGLLAVSYQKKLIEEVIDAEEDGLALSNDTVFTALHRAKSANYVTLYGRTASIPLLSGEEDRVWSEYDIHFNSDVFYLSGYMYEPTSSMRQFAERLQSVEAIDTDSVLVVAGSDKVEAAVSGVAALPRNTLFDECISNLSHDASYIMVADMDKVAQNPEQYASYLPLFIKEHSDLFRSFILSVQITELENRLSHIFVFTYKE